MPAILRFGGVMPEFVNPKYTDATKTAFKSPTRLECRATHRDTLLVMSEDKSFCKAWFTEGLIY